MNTAPWGSPDGRTGAREPAIRIPPGVLIVLASNLGGHLLQSLAADPDAPLGALGLSPAGLAQGRWWTLATVVLVHGGWAHAGLNALGALAFGPPVARRLGGSWAGVVRFLAFYIVCAVLASLGYVLVHWNGREVLVGASGAISGLMGASSRLLDRSPPGHADRLAPFASRTVVGMAAAWGIINLLMALGWSGVGVRGPIAWEAHLFGYAAGLLLIGPAARLSPPPASSLQHPRV